MDIEKLNTKNYREEGCKDNEAGLQQDSGDEASELITGPGAEGNDLPVVLDD